MALPAAAVPAIVLALAIAPIASALPIVAAPIEALADPVSLVPAEVWKTLPGLSPGIAGPKPPGWWDTWAFDRDHDHVDDDVERLVEEAILEGEPSRLVPTIVDFSRKARATDADALAALGAPRDSLYVSKYSFFVHALLPADRVSVVAALPEVVMVEWDYPVEMSLDVSARAAKARPSDFYSPDTAWDQGYKGEGMVIAILDTGVQNDHESLAGKFVQGAITSAPQVVDCVDPADDVGHGTHVASEALGNGPDFKGTAPEARLVDVKISVTIGTIGGIERGIEWVRSFNDGTSCHGPPGDDTVDVVSISFGSTGRGGNGDAGSDMETVNGAVAAGLVIVIAAGNCGPQPSATCDEGDDEFIISSPGTAAGAITVAASDDRNTVNRADDVIGTYSSRGPNQGSTKPYELREMKPEIAAPGTNILGADFIDPEGYVSESGTSMATPHVSGICALILQANPYLRPTAADKNPVRDLLVQTAEYRDQGAKADHTSPGWFGQTWNNAWGYGYVDASKAVQKALGIALDPLSVDAGGSYVGGPSEAVAVEGASSGGKGPITYAWSGPAALTFADPAKLATTVTSATLGKFAITLQATDANGVVRTDAALLEINNTHLWLLNDVEGDQSAWEVTGDGNLVDWHVTTHKSSSPTHSWTNSHDVTRLYNSNQDTRLTSPAFDASNSSSLTVRFNAQGEMEAGFDFVKAQLSVDGAAYETVGSITGLHAASTAFSFRAPTALSGGEVRLRFQATSDTNLETEGFYVDDVELVGTVPTASTDSTAPSGGAGLVVTDPETGTALDLAWDASTDESGVLRYRVERSETAGGPYVLVAQPGTNRFRDTGLATGTTYHYVVSAEDGSGNVGTPSAEGSGTPTSKVDLEPPSKVVVSIKDPLDGDRLKVSWTAATDNVAVDHYDVFRSTDGSLGDLLSTTTDLTLLDLGLSEGTTYTYAVLAVDTNGNVGDVSDLASAAPRLAPRIAGWKQFQHDAEHSALFDGTGVATSASLLAHGKLSASKGSGAALGDLDLDGVNEIVLVTDALDGDDAIRAAAYRYNSTTKKLDELWSYEVPFDGTGEYTRGGGGVPGVVDLDGDKRPEVVFTTNYVTDLEVATVNNARITLLDGETGAKLSEAGLTIVDDRAGVAIGDVDGDGIPEVVATHVVGGSSGGSFVTAFNWDGAGFTQKWDEKVAASGRFPGPPVLAELDGSHDGLELVVGRDGFSLAGGDSGDVSLYRPTATGAGTPVTINVESGVRGLAAGDFDGDGQREVAIHVRNKDLSLQVLEWTGGGFTRVKAASGPLWNAPAVGDLDGDGKPEILSIQNDGSDAGVIEDGDLHVWAYDGAALKEKAVLRFPALTFSYEVPGGVALADVEGDGKTEVLFAGLEGKLHARRFAGGKIDESVWTYDLASTGLVPGNTDVEAPLAIGDVTGDGKLDIVVEAKEFAFVIGKLAPPNRAPVLDPIGDRTVEELDALEFVLTATDADGDALSYSASGLPAGATFTPATRTFSWVPGLGDAGTYAGILFTVSDGKLSDSETISIEVTAFNHAPVFDPIADVVADEGTLVEFTVSATDADGDPLTYSAALLPEGATFDASTRTFSWTPTLSQAGTYHPVFKATDGKEPVSETANVEIRNVNQAPTAAFRVTTPAKAGVAVPFTDESTDPDGDGDLSAWSWAFGDGATSDARNPTHVFAAGTYDVTLTVEDAAGLQSTATRTVEIDGLAPVTTATPDRAPDRNGWYNKKVSVTLAAADDLSGVKVTKHKTNDEAFKDYKTPIEYSGEGVKNLRFYSEDKVGNVESTVGPVVVKVDTVPPTVRIVDPYQTGTPPVIVLEKTIRVDASDKTSGMEKVAFFLDGVLLGVDADAAGGWTFDYVAQPGDAGKRTLLAVGTDVAGNTWSDDVDVIVVGAGVGLPVGALPPVPAGTPDPAAPALPAAAGDARAGALAASGPAAPVATAAALPETPAAPVVSRVRVLP